MVDDFNPRAREERDSVFAQQRHSINISIHAREERDAIAYVRLYCPGHLNPRAVKSATKHWQTDYLGCDVFPRS